MIRTAFVINLSILFALPQAFAGEKVDLTLAAEKNGSIYIENVRGTLKISGWDKPLITVKGELDDSARQLVFKTKGRKAIVKVAMKGMNAKGHGSDLEVFVPHNSKLRFKGVDTDYHVSGLEAKIEGQSIKGDIVLEDIHGKMRMSVVSGQIKVHKSSGKLIAESVNGQLEYDGAFTKAALRSMSGKIVANIAQTEKLHANSASGDILVNGYLRSNADIKLNSVNGDIQYTSDGKFNGECEVASKFGGKISNKLTEDKPWSESMKQQKLKFVSGDGSGKLVMHTVSGNISLEK